MYQQCVAYVIQDLWQLQTQLFSSQLSMAKSFESLKQVIPFSTFSLSPLLSSSPLSVLTFNFIVHHSLILRFRGSERTSTACRRWENKGIPAQQQLPGWPCIGWGDQHLFRCRRGRRHYSKDYILTFNSVYFVFASSSFARLGSFLLWLSDLKQEIIVFHLICLVTRGRKQRIWESLQ